MDKNILKMIKNQSGILVESSEVYSFSAHLHNYTEIILYQEFDGVVFIGENSFKVNNYMAVLISTLDIHRIQVENSLNSKYVKICVDLGEDFNGDNSSYLLNGLSNDDFLVELFKKIALESDATYKNLLANLIIYHIKKHGDRLSVNTNGKKMVIDALKYINDNYQNQITLSSCAKYVSVTKEHLSKMFSLTTGITFSKYLSNLRINKACELLVTTNKTVTEVCFDSGYGNLSHFLRVFTKNKGISPFKYKKLQSNL